MITSNYFVVVIIVCEGWSIRWVLRSFIQKVPATNFRPVPSATLSVPPLSVLLLRRPQSGRGFKIIEHLTATDMERQYLALLDGSTAGRVTALYCLVHAAVSV